MKIYHVETQGDYDSLMIELEEKGCEWRCVEKPTKLDKFKIYGKDTYIYEEYGIISLSDGYYSKVYRSNEALIEYKAKGENMTQEEMNKNTLDWAKNVSVSVESLFARGTLAVESDLKEAKSSAKKLIEKIDEYLETLKPKFKVGDYVVEQNGDVISKINEVMNGRFFGSYYKRFDNYFYSDNCSIFPNNIERYATTKALPEVPQCVDYAIRSLSDGIRGAFDVIYLIKCTVEQEKRYTPNWVEVYEWIFEYGNSAIFERAFLDGYTVEKPKELLYFVKLPGMRADLAYLCKSCSPGELGYHEKYSSKETNKISFSSRYDKKYYGGWQRQFTEQEIKDIDPRYLAFSVKVEED